MELSILEPETKQKRRGRKKSNVWEHFIVKTDEPGFGRAYCIKCNKSYAYMKDSKLSGTSHVKRHVSLCQNNRQTACPKTGANLPKKRARTKPHSSAISFDQCKNMIAKMIILHDYSLHMVEDQGFIDLLRALQPNFNPLSFNAVQEDCVDMYLTGKKRLLNLIDGIPGRVNLTLDIWTSNQTSVYVFLRGHFIDGDWKLHHPILNVVMVPFLDFDGSLDQTIVTCLSDWHLEGRVFTLALDKFYSNGNEALMRKLRDLLSLKSPSILCGQLLSQNCYACVLSRLALDALGAMRETIGKVRESVKYMKSHEKKFFELRQQLQIPSMVELSIDDQNKWDTVYRMLVAACELKQVFDCFDSSDPDYRMTLTMDDWQQVETLCVYLKYLYDAANILTVQPYPTANLFFPEVSKLLLELTHAAALSQDPFCSSLIMPLKEKLEQYWKENCLMLAVAVAMDPRCKMKLVESTFGHIFGNNAESCIRIVRDGLHRLFHDYVKSVLPYTTTNGDEGNEAMIKTESFEEGSIESALSEFDIYISDLIGNQQWKTELTEYLEEPLEPIVQKFDILNWWRVNRLKYPILSRMASDILSISASTLSANFVFDTEIRKMDSYRSSLDSLTLEALICMKDWFQDKSLPIDVSNALVKVDC
ncbi:zinc finger BED domain-containing protein DAYSLEEPER-like [Gastrolobium bilobum]|uniref:zinc finger BED domain-containing protein DAYSLEEPER-like n=1 Tax=Gastrolobium bilobum TaxID=150636 RepID=UPI002AB312F8|nr:zinc finger BED domain-containing protein DAYSLEEPER-like [Gastrolobium bilobum]